LSDLSRLTKITVGNLRAIESDQLGKLPGGVYTRGFLRAYAREVGCDPEDIVRRYRAQVDATGGEDAKAMDPTAPPISCEAGQLHAADSDAMDRRNARRQTLLATTALLLGGLLYVSMHFDIRRPRKDIPPAAFAGLPAAPAAPADIPKPVEVGTSGSSSRTATTDEQAEGLRLAIQPRAACWLSATADGKLVVYRLLNSGEQSEVDAHEDVVLRVGDAAAFAFTINGAAGRSLGSAGQPVTIHLTRQNYQEFLANR